MAKPKTAKKLKKAKAERRAHMITGSDIAAIGHRRDRTAEELTPRAVFEIAQPAPGVVPAPKEGEPNPLAADDNIVAVYNYANEFGVWGNEFAWLGYPVLSEMMQRPEYRNIVETRAEEMTREWLEFTAVGDDAPNKAIKLKEIEQWFEDRGLPALVQRALEHDGAFGIGHLFVDMGKSEGPSLQTALFVDPRTIKKNSVKGFRTVEPIWTYPNAYNSNNPLRKDFFRPQSWFVNGQIVHRSRLLTFISHEVPDILKPAYAFGGLSLIQVARSYVDRWLRTVNSVSDMVHSYSVMVLATNLAATLEKHNMDGVLNRVAMANRFRDNQGTQIIDKETEQLLNVSAPIAGLDKLQAQSQEQIASIIKTPLVKYLGTTPAGLNATADGEIRVYYDSIAAAQKKTVSPIIHILLKIAQLDLYGSIDPEIGFKWVPLWQLDAAAQAAVRKTEADTDIELIDAGVIDPEDSRRRIAEDPDSPFYGIDPDAVPEPPETPGDPSLLPDPAASAEPKEVERSGD
jgi:phage-related protein (TIGR01555 family)